MNMREIMARAMFERPRVAEGKSPESPTTWEDADQARQDYWLRNADACLNAMSEPTLVMGDKMRDITGAGYPYSPDPIPPLGHLQISLIWRAGIDTAKEGK